ncbi:hypothetical protein DDR33_24760, partial [Pararcticibacter amylolyticus]
SCKKEKRFSPLQSQNEQHFEKGNKKSRRRKAGSIEKKPKANGTQLIAFRYSGTGTGKRKSS